jgi:hypothetical protein
MKSKSWIFVSHASADLAAVRQVRNYLESKDASPLLFHLLALKHEDEFWPIIEREIAERDFFLLCESEAADRSDWVRRERAAVREAAQHRSKRVGSIRVDVGEIDYHQLDRFLGTMRVFPSYRHLDQHRVTPFLNVLAARGFELFDYKKHLRLGDSWVDQVQAELSGAAAYGFVLIFLTRDTSRSEWVLREVDFARQVNARLIPVRLDGDLSGADLPPALTQLHWFDATREPETAADRLADFLHSQTL